MKNFFKKLWDGITNKLVEVIIGFIVILCLYLSKNYFFIEINVYLLYLIVIFAILIISIYFNIRSFLKSKKSYVLYDLPIVKESHDGHRPILKYNTKTYFKNYKDFFYIPDISTSGYSRFWIGIFGPYCEKCNNVLDNGKKYYKHFYCTSCDINYNIPKELNHPNYLGRLDEYFRYKFDKGEIN